MISFVGLLVPLLLLVVFLLALYFVVAAGVEQGIRRALPDASLRPTYAERRRQQQQRERDW